jgi:hypothetical protein
MEWGGGFRGGTGFGSEYQFASNSLGRTQSLISCNQYNKRWSSGSSKHRREEEKQEARYRGIGSWGRGIVTREDDVSWLL